MLLLSAFNTSTRAPLYPIIVDADRSYSTSLLKAGSLLVHQGGGARGCRGSIQPRDLLCKWLRCTSGPQAGHQLDSLKALLKLLVSGSFCTIHFALFQIL